MGTRRLSFKTGVHIPIVSERNRQKRMCRDSARRQYVSASRITVLKYKSHSFRFGHTGKEEKDSISNCFIFILLYLYLIALDCPT